MADPKMSEKGSLADNPHATELSDHVGEGSLLDVQLDKVKERKLLVKLDLAFIPVSSF